MMPTASADGEAGSFRARCIYPNFRLEVRLAVCASSQGPIMSPFPSDCRRVKLSPRRDFHPIRWIAGTTCNLVAINDLISMSLPPKQATSENPRPGHRLCAGPRETSSKELGDAELVFNNSRRNGEHGGKPIEYP